jgi:hypothetical protein
VARHEALPVYVQAKKAQGIQTVPRELRREDLPSLGQGTPGGQDPQQPDVAAAELARRGQARPGSANALPGWRTTEGPVDLRSVRNGQRMDALSWLLSDAGWRRDWEKAGRWQGGLPPTRNKG